MISTGLQGSFRKAPRRELGIEKAGSPQSVISSTIVRVVVRVRVRDSNLESKLVAISSSVLPVSGCSLSGLWEPDGKLQQSSVVSELYPCARRLCGAET